ncbi:gluconokinase [Beijerinckia sp. L45]|uniref:gluconokinase n=1 Tax=Beijerinckia sp. L45 TaxID=1641855 RepID=UPI00131ABF99|nr:gluconokinase [Beijerinckia sp. L45]
MQGGLEGLHRHGTPLAIVLFGVSGTGKTTVGKRLAPSMGATFLEGDSYHSSANVAKMRSGTPLDDADRWPWLAKIAGAIAAHVHGDRPVVAACSALKVVYRDKLREAARVPLTFVHLAIDPQMIAHRLVARSQHFMPPSLLQSQLDALEPLEPHEIGTSIAETGTALQTVEAIRRWLQYPEHEKGRPSRPFPGLKSE